jgi:glucan 1,3-beta-glucosidase
MKFLSYVSVLATATYCCSAQAFYGLNFGIDQNNCPPVSHYVNEFEHIQPYTNRVRSYTMGVCNEGKKRA